MIDITWLIMPMIIYAAGKIKAEDLPATIDVGIITDEEFAVIHWDVNKIVNKITSDTWSITLPENSLELWKKIHRYTGEPSRGQIIYDFSGDADDFESDLATLMLAMPQVSNDWDFITYHVKY